jgi:2'-5' RNA ligase
MTQDSQLTTDRNIKGEAPGSSVHMRLFAAVELSDEARAAIASEQQKLATALGAVARSLRFVRAGHMHLTLVFIGEIAEARGGPIVEVMSGDIAQAPFQVVFGGVGTFPRDGAPRVLWLGVVRGAPELVELAALVARRLAAVGVVVEPRAFRPHLTLARWRERSRAGRPPLLESTALVARVDVGAVTLYQSRLSPAGPSYTALARARLICP